MSAKFWELAGTEAGEEVRYYFSTSAGILAEDTEAGAGSFIGLGRFHGDQMLADEAAFVFGVANYLSSGAARITSTREVSAIPCDLDRNLIGGKPGSGTFLITLHKKTGGA